MADIIEGVKPTRMELLGIRKRRALAEKGHKLLGEKRDALVTNFFDIIGKRDAIREKMENDLARAYGSLIEAQMLIGEERVADIALDMPAAGDITVSTINIMGVRVPQLGGEAAEYAKKAAYGFTATSAKLDEAIRDFRKALEGIIRLAEVEGGIQRIAVEIEKTKRRVNALEHIFIPRLKATVKYIEMQLEEREREDFFRRKRIKALMEAGAKSDAAKAANA
ncbi:MAG: V-type ATP synthase subunit D [Thermoplasmata archaeon HGW-Thermoplasmata-1]|nr:MAG: V-type ATP synthase subunit D [Thermoplasmata archaeon HGW-Thermoplasmata-1]